MRKTYVYDPESKSMIEKHLAPYRGPKGVHIIPDIEPFKSPITGEIIGSRNKMKRHMKEHDVTRAEDYSPQYYEKAAQERQLRMNSQTSHDKRDRIEALKYALEKRS